MEQKIRLTQTVAAAGCAAKLDPGLLTELLSSVEMPVNENLIVGIEKLDDAGVYKITDEIALVQTLDFFTPIVDDPYLFGQIAATNALSDVYAMGGRPVTAMNIVCFPSAKLDKSILAEIIKGGISKIREAGAVLAGGHSIMDNEIKSGLSVTGLVHPARIWRNRAAVNSRPLYGGMGLRKAWLRDSTLTIGKPGLFWPSKRRAASIIRNTKNNSVSQNPRLHGIWMGLSKKESLRRLAPPVKGRIIYLTIKGSQRTQRAQRAQNLEIREMFRISRNAKLYYR